MTTLKQYVEEILRNLKEWSDELNRTDSEKAKAVGKEIASYLSGGDGLKYKLEEPLKELSRLHKDKIGRYD